MMNYKDMPADLQQAILKARKGKGAPKVDQSREALPQAAIGGRRDQSAYMKKYYQENKERCKKNQRDYYRGNKEHCQKYQREYYNNHREVMREYYRKYYQKNKEKLIDQSRRYREKKKAS